MERKNRIVVCDEPLLLPRLRKLFASVKVLPLAEFSPNGMPAVIITAPQNLAAANHLRDHISSTARARSVVTGRMRMGESVSAQQPVGTVLLPWCNDDVFVQWLTLLLGLQDQPVFPEWFFLRSSPPIKPPDFRPG
jgi:hypothetical protein